ncbi:hypothetical protein [Rathayibacter sp. AY2B3]|uniref:hypothetical protein n=1 Tax=Rathayibacter sp. AY2B3 TaxID=2080569 RepID=UPI0011B047EC|nr:hypothetical protein [Rathayibacter sp. AY2B3]
MFDNEWREQLLEQLSPLSSISAQGDRGLAMLSRGIQLAHTSEISEEPISTTGNLISYCVRDAMDSIFPKLDDPRIKDAAQQLVKRWRQSIDVVDSDLRTALQKELNSLEKAVAASNKGFLSRVAGFIGVLNPGLPADLSIPAMNEMRELNKAANAGVHGSTTYDDALALLNRVLERLVELVAPLAVTSRQYRELVRSKDFESISVLLSSNPDPRIRVYLFDNVRDPLLARTIHIEELLPGRSAWLAYSYVRHLAINNSDEFKALIDRIDADRKLTAEVAAELLDCASIAGAAVAFEVDRLSRKAGREMHSAYVARWLQTQVNGSPKWIWWRVLTRLVTNLDVLARQYHSVHGMNLVLESALSQLPTAAPPDRSKFSSAIINALTQLDRQTPHAIEQHFRYKSTRAQTLAHVLIETSLEVVATEQALGETVDLTMLGKRSHEALVAAALAKAIETSDPGRRALLARRGFDLVIDRMSNSEWPEVPDYNLLAATLPLLGDEAVSSIRAILGEAPSPDVVSADLDPAVSYRADWFREAQWTAYLPEDARPEMWRRVLQQAATQDVNFGPQPAYDPSVAPRAHSSPLQDIDFDDMTVVDLTEVLNSSSALGDPGDPNLLSRRYQQIEAHVKFHREEWLTHFRSVARIQDLGSRLHVLRALKSDAGEAPMPSWGELKSLWMNLLAEVNDFALNGNESAKPVASQLAETVLEHLRHRVAEQPPQAEDIDWWTEEVLPASILMVTWFGSQEHDYGMPALFSVRGEVVHLLVALSSPIDGNITRDVALSHALDRLASIALSDLLFTRSIGHWARWLLHRDAQWWERYSGQFVGPNSSLESRSMLLTANWDSGNFALALLASDLAHLNSYASESTDAAALPALTAVLFNILPITAIEESTWSAIFRDESSCESALRFLFPEHTIDDDPAGSRRIEILRWVAVHAGGGTNLWRASDVLAGSPDLSDVDLFSFTAGLAKSHRGAPLSMGVMSVRLVRSLNLPDAVTTLEAICAGNLGADRPMAQYDIQAVNLWFQESGDTLRPDLRTRVHHALFEIGFFSEENGRPF